MDTGNQLYLEEKKDVPSPYLPEEYICYGFHDKQVIHIQRVALHYHLPGDQLQE